MAGVLARPAAAMRRPAAALRRPAANPEEEPDGPTGPYESASSTREGRAKRQYTWWMTMSYPYPETVARLNLRTPEGDTADTDACNNKNMADTTGLKHVDGFSHVVSVAQTHRDSKSYGILQHMACLLHKEYSAVQSIIPCE